MGHKIQEVDKRYSPSPSAYNLTRHTIGNNGNKWGFGSEVRKGLMSKSLSPGPGAYTTKSVAFDIEKPRFFMGEKIKDLKNHTQVPGPQQYDPNYKSSKKGMPSYPMGIKLGSSLGKGTIGPGPGNYQFTLSNKKKAPQFGFGSSTRDSGTGIKLNSPGPGAYRLKSSIGDVPDYAIPNRSDAQKYV